MKDTPMYQLQVLSIADLPGDDDAARLRKRVGVAAVYLTVLASLGVAASA